MPHNIQILHVVKVSMANSSWTAEHVRQLFLSWVPPLRVYPPCDTADLAALPLERKLKRLYIVSLAQVLLKRAMLLVIFSSSACSCLCLP
jgi:hypothetical protein